MDRGRGGGEYSGASGVAGKRRRDSSSSIPATPPSRSPSPPPPSRGGEHSTHYGHPHAHHHHRHEHHYRRSRSEERSPSSASSEVSGSVDSTAEEATHLQLSKSELVADRYRVLGECGKGTFGRVFLCRDMKRNFEVALKAVRSVKRYTEAAKIEAEILNEVNKADPTGASLVVRLLKAFGYHKHLCLVFEPLGPSLYDYVKANDHCPLPLYCVQAFADQLLTSISFMHEMKLIHTDLKLENILLVDRSGFFWTDKMTCTRRSETRVLAPRSTDIRLIDFGGATYDWERKSSLINTRQYRAPEVLLGLGWSMPSDIWSAGCIFMELYIGELLFQTHDNAEHLALMEAILGPFPSSITQHPSKEVRKYFDKYGRVKFPTHTTTSESIRHVRSARRLDQSVHPRDVIFLDLVRHMLAYDPETRITAKEALNHRFFTVVRNFKDVPRPVYLPPSAPKELFDKLGIPRPGTKRPAEQKDVAQLVSRVTMVDDNAPKSESLPRRRMSDPYQRVLPRGSDAGAFHQTVEDSRSYSRGAAGHRDEYGRVIRRQSRSSSRPQEGCRGGRSSPRAERRSPSPRGDERFERGAPEYRRPHDRYVPGDRPAFPGSRHHSGYDMGESPLQKRAHARRRTEAYGEPEGLPSSGGRHSGGLNSDTPSGRRPTSDSTATGLTHSFHSLLRAPPDGLGSRARLVPEDPPLSGRKPVAQQASGGSPESNVIAGDARYVSPLGAFSARLTAPAPTIAEVHSPTQTKPPRRGSTSARHRATAVTAPVVDDEL